MSKCVLLIRADASPKIGWGHVLRCLALAQAWQDAGGEAVFVCAQLPESLEARLKSEMCAVQRISIDIASSDDARQTGGIARSVDAQYIVCDGYNFDNRFFRALTSCGTPLGILDDSSNADLGAADFILNPNAGATPELYARFVAPTRVFAGAQFALLRREFRLKNWNEKAIAPQIERVLIAMGGTDAGNLTSRALQFLQNQNFKGKVVVLGAAPTEKWDDFGFDLCWAQAQREVPVWMNWCDIALAAAGSMTWELSCCGVPAILTPVAPNQRALAHWCARNRVAWALEAPNQEWENLLQDAWKNAHNFDARRKLSARARQTIDGQGASRVARALWPDALQLRAATLDDARILLEWRNDATTRAMSLQSDIIDGTSHRQWLQAQIASDDNTIWMASQNGELVGSVRFSRDETKLQATISVAISPENRGRGLGRQLIETACRALLWFWSVERIRAVIKPENIASRRAFEKAGFVCHTETDSIADMSFLTFFLERRR